jgi:hypothetical protein
MLPSARFSLLKILPYLCLVFLAPASVAQTSKQTAPSVLVEVTPSVKAGEELKADLQRQIGWDDNLPSEVNPTGLQFQFSKIGDKTFPQGHAVNYRAYVHGAAENKKYSLGIWKVGAEMQILPTDVYVNAKGLLMDHKPRPDQENKDSVEEEDEIDLALQAARGEPIRVVLATADGKLMVPGTVVPFPIVGKDKNCRLEIRLATPDAEAILVYADGLPPNTEVPFQSNSAGEQGQASFSVNAHGHAATADMPYVEGKASGVVKETLATKECSVSVEIPWGKGSYKPL